MFRPCSADTLFQKQSFDWVWGLQWPEAGGEVTATLCHPWPSTDLAGTRLWLTAGFHWGSSTYSSALTSKSHQTPKGRRKEQSELHKMFQHQRRGGQNPSSSLQYQRWLPVTQITAQPIQLKASGRKPNSLLFSFSFSNITRFINVIILLKKEIHEGPWNCHKTSLSTSLNSSNLSFSWVSVLLVLTSAAPNINTFKNCISRKMVNRWNLICLIH